ncbi:MAG: response regulator, partial [Vicinamibacteraceae bacterium]
MRIVVIEDDAVVSETIALYLQQDGFEVVTARDGVTGLQLAMSGDVSLIVLDLMIPGLSGMEVCRRLRTSSTVPIL